MKGRPVQTDHSLSQRPAWFVSWSPGAIGAALVAIIVALGGAQGIRELLGASEATQRAVADSEARILARLDEHSRIEREERAKILRTAQIESERVKQHAELICAFNDGLPHETWPCGDLRLDPPERGHVSPLWRTARRYPVP